MRGDALDGITSRIERQKAGILKVQSLSLLLWRVGNERSRIIAIFYRPDEIWKAMLWEFCRLLVVYLGWSFLHTIGSQICFSLQQEKNQMWHDCGVLNVESRNLIAEP